MRKNLKGTLCVLTLFVPLTSTPFHYGCTKTSIKHKTKKSSFKNSNYFKRIEFSKTMFIQLKNSSKVMT